MSSSTYSSIANVYQAGDNDPDDLVRETDQQSLEPFEADFNFVNFVMKYRIPVYDLNELTQFLSPRCGISLNGASADVFKGEKAGVTFAIKRMKIRRPDDVDSIHKIANCQEANRSNLNCFGKEVRFLSYEILKRSSNVSQLLGVSWSIDRESIGPQHQEGDILRPILILSLENTTLQEFMSCQSPLENDPQNLQLKMSLIVDIFYGLMILHHEGLIHSDIKPANILVREHEGRVTAKVGDFGLSIQRDHSDDEITGTLDWWSPEAHAQRRGDKQHIASPQTLALEQARDVYSAGLVALFILKGGESVLPSVADMGTADALVMPATDDTRWENLKNSAQAYNEDWMRRNFRILDESEQVVEISQGSIATLNSNASQKEQTFQYLDAKNNESNWLTVPATIPREICLIPMYTLQKLAEERETAEVIFNNLKQSDDLRPIERLDWKAAMPRIQPWNIQGGFEAEDIPVSITISTIKYFQERARMEGSSSTMKHFVGVQLLEMSHEEEWQERGRQLLLDAALHSISDSRLEQIQVREAAVVAFLTSGTPITGHITLQQKREWVLDAIFLRRGGYFYYHDDQAHIEKLELVRDHFNKALESFEDDVVERILNIGLALYAIHIPTEVEERPKPRNITNEFWKAVFAADENRMTGALEDGLALDYLFDVRLVREVVHHGLDDSLRALGRLDTLVAVRRTQGRYHFDTEASGSCELAANSLAAAISDKSYLRILPPGSRPQRVMPVLFEAVDSHALSCLFECLRYRPTTLDSAWLTYQTCVETALIMAVKMARPYLVAALLVFGANPNTKCECCEKAPIHHILEFDAMEKGTTVCNTVAWRHHDSYVNAERNEVSEADMIEDIYICMVLCFFLIVKSPGFDVLLENKDGESPMVLCIRRRNVDAMHMLWEAGADLGTICSTSRRTAYHAAATDDNSDFLEIVANEQPELINSTDMHGSSPLAYAAATGNDGPCLFLLEHGATLEVKDSDGRNPIHLAFQQGHMQVALLLLKWASDNLVAERYATLLEDVDNSKRHILHHWCQAIARRVRECASVHSSSEKLLEYMTQLNEAVRQKMVRAADSFGVTPLHWIAFSGHFLLMDELINGGADVNAKSASGQTPLHFAASRNDDEAFEYLQTRNADIEITDINGSQANMFRFIPSKQIIKLMDESYPESSLGYPEITNVGHYSFPDDAWPGSQEDFDIQAVDSDNDPLAELEEDSEEIQEDETNEELGTDAGTSKIREQWREEIRQSESADAMEQELHEAMLSMLLRSIRE